MMLGAPVEQHLVHVARVDPLAAYMALDEVPAILLLRPVEIMIPHGYADFFAAFLAAFFAAFFAAGLAPLPDAGALPFMLRSR